MEKVLIEMIQAIWAAESAGYNQYEDRIIVNALIHKMKSESSHPDIIKFQQEMQRNSK